MSERKGHLRLTSRTESRISSAEIGSLIYFGDEAVVRNATQKRAMEDSRLGIPIIFGHDVIHINDPYSKITRPVKELRFFEKKLIKAGESAILVS